MIYAIRRKTVIALVTTAALLVLAIIVFQVIFGGPSVAIKKIYLTEEEFNQLPDNSFWSWKIHTVEADRLVFTCTDINIPVKEIVSVHATPVTILSLSGESKNVAAEVLVETDGEIVLKLSSITVSNVDSIEILTICECLRTGLLGRGAYSSSWRSKFSVENGKIVPVNP